MSADGLRRLCLVRYRLIRTAAVLAVVVLAATSCGGSGPDPGLAARIRALRQAALASACPQATPDPAILSGAAALLPEHSYVVPCSRVLALAKPSPVGPIEVGADQRTLVIPISWNRPCVELARIDVTETATEIQVAVFYGTDPEVKGGSSPAAPAGSQVCTSDYIRRLTAVRLSAPLGGRTIVSVGQVLPAP